MSCAKRSERPDPDLNGDVPAGSQESVNACVTSPFRIGGGFFQALDTNEVQRMVIDRDLLGSAQPSE